MPAGAAWARRNGARRFTARVPVEQLRVDLVERRHGREPVVGDDDVDASKTLSTSDTSRAGARASERSAPNVCATPPADPISAATISATVERDFPGQLSQRP
jgi:hypothetical protein